MYLLVGSGKITVSAIITFGSYYYRFWNRDKLFSQTFISYNHLFDL